LVGRQLGLGAERFGHSSPVGGIATIVPASEIPRYTIGRRLLCPDGRIGM